MVEPDKKTYTMAFKKDNGNFKHKRRSFIKKIGLGAGIFAFPGCGTYNLYEDQDNNNVLNVKKDNFSDLTLLYNRPADINTYRLHAMPIGNGSVGAMFDGHPENENIIINHDRLRPVFYKEKENNVSKYLPLVRKLFLSGKYEEAQDTFNKMQLENGGKRQLNNYHEVCDLIIDMPLNSPAAGYQRLLDLQDGVGTVKFSSKGINYKKTYFASVPDDLVVVNLKASKPKSINCTISLGRMPMESCIIDGSTGSDHILLKGKYSDNTRFEVLVQLISIGGSITPQIKSYSGIGESNASKAEKIGESNGNKIEKLLSLSVSNANELTILTNVRVYNDLSNKTSFKITIPEGLDYKSILSRHRQEYQQKFNRVSFQLSPNTDSKDEFPDAIKLLDQARNDNPSNKLFELIFQTGRYVLLASSRPNSLPANLQGIWSSGYNPAWNCRYQLDLNVQMSYWLANPVNLAECNLPLFDYLEEKLVPAAIRRSKDLYNCRGISLPVGVDEVNVRYPSNSETQGIAGWLAQHFWEHYQFTLDREFLVNRAYPFMVKAGEFFEDFLFENEEGKYVILPSASPENPPKNFPGRLSKNATIDLAIAKELFSNLINASLILKTDSQRRDKWQNILTKLPEWPMDTDNTLLEWADNNAEENQGHRHFSHLYPLFPGSLFDLEKEPDLVYSAIKAIKKREAAFLKDACGWSYTWLVSLYARAGMGEDAYRNLLIYAKGFVTADNYLSAISDLSGLGLGRTRHKHLIQTEAGLGITASIAEMLLQSHNGLIRILPALPKIWGDGVINGLKARGNHEIGIFWKSGYISKVVLKSKFDSLCRIKFYRDFNGKMKLRTNKSEGVEFKKIADNTYTFESKSNVDYEFYSD